MGLAAILGLILPTLPTIIAGVERLFGKKTAAPATPATPAPDTSTAKFTAVFEQVMTLINNALAGGQIPHGTVVSDDAVKGAIETVVQQLNKLGLLKGTETDMAAIINALGPLVGTIEAKLTPTAPAASPSTGTAMTPGSILRVVVIG